MAGSRSNTETGVCKYCNQNVVLNGAKCVRCVKCEAVYHSACSERIKTRKTIDPVKNLIECCLEVDSLPIEDKSSGEREFSDCKLEVKYLRALLAEKDARIENLIKINSLLEHKIEYMEKINNHSTDKQIPDNEKTPKGKNIQPELPKKYKISANTDKQPIDKTENVKKMANKQRQLMNEIVNLDIYHQECEAVLPGENILGQNGEKIPHGGLSIEPGSSANMNAEDDQPATVGDTWKVSNGRRKRTRMRGKHADTAIIGSSSETNRMKAVPEIVTLYVTRLSTETRAVDVTTQLRNRFPEVKTEEVTSRFPDIYKSFKVTLHKSNYEAAMKPDVWPAGVRVDRFFHRRPRREPPT